MKKQFAVFDIDQSVSRSTLLEMTIAELINRGLLAQLKGKEISLLLQQYKASSGSSYPEVMAKACELMFGGLAKPLSVAEYEQIIDSVVKQAHLHTYVYTRELLQTLKRNNFFLIALSGAEVRALATFARSLGFDAWVGQANFIDEEGKFKGKVQTYTQDKAQMLDMVVKKFDLSMKGSTAIGDSLLDAKILDQVDAPIVFNPNQALFKVAREKNWMIVIERKDMVYGMIKQGNDYVLKQVNA